MVKQVGKWTEMRAADFIEFNPRMSIKKGTIATKVAMDKLQPFTKKIPETEKAPFSGGSKFRNGDTIMARITPCLENGKTAFVDILGEDEIAFGSTEFIVMRAKEGVSDPQFIYYLATSPSFRNIAIKSMVGSSGRQRVQQTVLDELVLSVPPLEEQKKISSLLCVLDQKIALNNEINDNLEQQASAMVDQYFESVSSTVSFSDIMSFESGFAFQSSTYLPNGQYRIITIKNVQDGQIDTTGAAYIDELPQRMKSGCLLQVGDALLSLTGNVGRTGIVCENGLLLNQRVAKIVPHRKELLPLLYFIFRQPSMKTQLESIAKGTAQLNLSPVETLKLSVPYDVDVSLKLANALAPIYQAVIANNQQSLILASIRDLLLPKLMSGEIDVSDIQL